ncbi:MAG: hypothetical protein MJZ81_06575 [Bacteroidales bacterium]|nr:hypothetical protein [Bacteroidales bacterium]
MRRKVKLSGRAVAEIKEVLRRHGYDAGTKPLKIVVGSTFKAFPFGNAGQCNGWAEALALNKSFNKQFNQ